VLESALSRRSQTWPASVIIAPAPELMGLHSELRSIRVDASGAANSRSEAALANPEVDAASTFRQLL
jgi:hypothetical protein